MNPDISFYFDDEVIEKLYPQWQYYCTLDQFKENCKDAEWDLYQTIISYNAPVPKTKTLTFFGEEIDPDKQYKYENYALICPYTRIGCTVYYEDRTDIMVGIAFYDC